MFRVLNTMEVFHCPAGVDHAIVGAGSGPSVVLAVGARTGEEARGEHGLVYPAEPAAQKHGAAVDRETTDPKEAYAGMEHAWRAYEPGRLLD